MALHSKAGVPAKLFLKAFVGKVIPTKEHDSILVDGINTSSGTKIRLVHSQ